MPYRIVAFCVARPSPSRDVLTMLELLYRSAALHDPGVRLTVLSDEHTDLSAFTLPADLVRYPLDPADLMLSRTRAQAMFAEAHDFAEPLAFLDLDILVNRPLGPLFARPFDVGLTVRRKRDMPINGGVIFAGARNPEAVRRFFARLRDIYESRYAAEGAWWGDQRALADLVAVESGDAGRERTMTHDGIDYLLLPGKLYNHAPHLLPLTVALPRSRKYLLHFKSADRKRYMAAYFAFHKELCELPFARRLSAARAHISR